MFFIYRRERSVHIWRQREGPYGKGATGGTWKGDHLEGPQRIKRKWGLRDGRGFTQTIFSPLSVKGSYWTDVCGSDRLGGWSKSMMTTSVCLAGNWRPVCHLPWGWRRHSWSGNSGRKETVQDLTIKVLEKRPAVGRVEWKSPQQVSNFPGISTHHHPNHRQTPDLMLVPRVMAPTEWWSGWVHSYHLLFSCSPWPLAFS